MAAISETAVSIASDHREDGTVVVPRPVLYRRVKDAADAEGIDHQTVRAAMAEAGWEYGRHLYFHPDELADRVAELAGTFREHGRLLVTHREVCDRIAESDDRVGVEGWQKGPYVEHVTAAFEAAGWLTDTIDGATSRVYVYPLFAAIRDEHPQGRFWHSPAELFGYYISTSVTAAIDTE